MWAPPFEPHHFGHLVVWLLLLLLLKEHCQWVTLGDNSNLSLHIRLLGPKAQGGAGSRAICREPEKHPRRLAPAVMDPENRSTTSLGQHLISQQKAPGPQGPLGTGAERAQPSASDLSQGGSQSLVLFLPQRRRFHGFFLSICTCESSPVCTKTFCTLASVS